MTIDALRILGGRGVFLLGMVVMTVGLRALAGSGVQRALARYTRTPLSAAAELPETRQPHAEPETPG
jgi:phosphate:Na+ symporter